MSSNLLIEISNLAVEFKTEDATILAVNDISFTLNKGETLGIVGESGSGKSVTSLSIMQLIQTPPGKIRSGEIIYYNSKDQGIDLLSLSKKEMRKYRGNEIAMIFQEPMTSLNPVHKCGKQVMETILLHQNVSKKEAKEKTISLFEEVKLPRTGEIFNSYPHQLSGGQKQRVMIAMAMSCNPSVLIADEPTTALDVTVQKTILVLMKELQKKYGMSIIFITHDLGVIAEIADEVIVMYKGKIVERGKIKELFLNPQHPYTKGLLACRPPLNKRPKTLSVVSDFMESKKGPNGEMLQAKEQKIPVEINSSERKAFHKQLYSREPILQIQNLKTYFLKSKPLFSKTREYVKAVNNVSFDVYEGETLGLVGESGCGKTTLGRTILRLVDSKEGNIIFKGINILNLSNVEFRKLRKDMQIIFQDPYSSLNPRITIGSAITEPMKVFNIGKSDEDRKYKAIELLEKVNMEARHFLRYPHEFSGGQRQRVCIARALALNPKFIICDESVSALDVSVQAQVLNLLNELKREFSFTYIFISHDLSVVKFMSDRMIVMKAGKIEEMGESDEIYANPQSEYTRRLIEAIPDSMSIVT